jgi:hypothetical protein
MWDQHRDAILRGPRSFHQVTVSNLERAEQVRRFRVGWEMHNDQWEADYVPDSGSHRLDNG